MYETLLNRARTARQGDGGFTLIELLIVITVLGILAGIVVFGVATFRDQANTAATNASCKTVSTAAEAWNAAHTTGYPGTVGDLQGANYIKTIPTGMTAGTAIGANGLAAGCTV